MVSLALMRNRKAILAVAAVLVVGGVYLFTTSVSQPGSGFSSGEPPPLPPGFPPVFPGAAAGASRTTPVEGGWQRQFTYTVRARAEDILVFYRGALMRAGLLVVAEGGGPYGGMLRAQDQGKKRAVYVDIDAPESAPQQIPRITLTVLDSAK
jgi:hypothetical protein